jgi:lipid A 3-O-deacylase
VIQFPPIRPPMNSRKYSCQSLDSRLASFSKQSVCQGSSIALLLVMLALAPAVSHGEAEESQTYKTAFSVVWENDLFSGNDNNYTNGISFNLTSAEVDGLGSKNFFAKTARAFSFLPTVGDAGYRNYVGFGLTQEMYTPPDITLPAPLPGEQPYAGVLMGDVTLFSKGPRSQHTFIFSAGMAGPASGAEQVQKLIHEITGSTEPMGWDTQLSNELLLNLGYAYDYRLLRKASPRRFGYDLSTGLGATLGNYITHAQGSAILRFGYDLPDTYNLPDLRVGSSKSVTLAPPPEKFRVYGTFGLTVAGVARFLPSDGNTFTDSLSGDRDDFYMNASAGITVAYKKIALLFSYNTILGDKQRPGDTTADYGSLSLLWFF